MWLCCLTRVLANESFHGQCYLYRSYWRVWSYNVLHTSSVTRLFRTTTEPPGILRMGILGWLGCLMSCLRFTIFVVWQNLRVPPPTVKLESMVHLWRGCFVKSSPVTWLENHPWIRWRTANFWCYILFHDLLMRDVTLIMTSAAIVFCEELIFDLLLCTLEWGGSVEAHVLFCLGQGKPPVSSLARIKIQNTRAESEIGLVFEVLPSWSWWRTLGKCKQIRQLCTQVVLEPSCFGIYWFRCWL